MENGIIVTLSGQKALRTRLDVIANNLANMNTTGFKREEVLFSSYIPRQRASWTSVDGPPTLVRDLATISDQSQGDLENTGSPLDVAIRGEGFFVVDGPEGPVFTRNGHFNVDQQGQLTTADGLPVLGSGGAPIIIPGDSKTIAISSDGTVSDTAGDLGRLSIVNFSRPELLQASGHGRWRTEETPTEMESPRLVQGMLESSNVKPIVEIEHLIQVHRSYTQAKNMIDREDERIKQMLQTYAA